MVLTMSAPPKEEITTSYKWTSWDREITSWNQRLQGENNFNHVREIYLPQMIKEKPKLYKMWQVGLGNTRIWLIMSKISPNIAMSN